MDYEEIDMSNSVEDAQGGMPDVVDGVSFDGGAPIDVAVDTPVESSDVSALVIGDEATGETATIYLISLDELVERLSDADGVEDGEPVDGTEELALEPDALTLIGVEEVGEAEAALLEVVEVIRDGLDHPALTTPFSEYTVTEGLLLLAVLGAFVSKLAKMLKGGFSWLLW